ncbi:flavin reductase family protein [Kaistia dalseonensis]|uniref:Flavin reductase (DIM6/NTAB) family NADH-FMN oxidoreductase RutF n=1 Tax=Kaistia dalseonensis TaxID=410840 RepID=A0ABU0H0T3_9HYPH|nr:flavin reductase family protein [Kaistia dalseonensis]MCX5493358.1 flavin reductase family protein [Kaistia dalseonensis]MDQ0435916.1 flavin reductase (DIM6/NTAB) family NADH-FMN oxidoreductase RutF [Kaistia dalseonensis]
MEANLPHYEGDPKHLREMFSCFPSGVIALLAEIDGEPKGMIASSFTVGVSIDPPLVSCAIQKTSSTWPQIKQAARLGISVLAEDHGALARQIASPNVAERFTDVPLRHTGSSARFIAGAPVWFEASFAGEFPAGDHMVALLQVRRVGADPNLRPLVFYRSAFLQLQLPEAGL